MRKLFAVAMSAALVGLGGFVRDANAGATIDLLFVGHNGSPIPQTDCVAVGGGAGCHTIAAGDQVTMAVVMTNNEPLTAMVFSLNYDLDLGNELAVVNVFSWSGVALNKAGTDRFQPLSGFSPSTPTFVGSFQGLTTNISLPRTLPAGTYQMGTVVWQVTPFATTDGADILSGLFNVGLDGTGDAAFNDLSGRMLFNSATVDGTIIPEPGTASLLGLGLLGLVVAGRRNRRA